MSLTTPPTYPTSLSKDDGPSWTDKLQTIFAGGILIAVIVFGIVFASKPATQTSTQDAVQQTQLTDHEGRIGDTENDVDDIKSDMELQDADLAIIFENLTQQYDVNTDLQDRMIALEDQVYFLDGRVASLESQLANLVFMDECERDGGVIIDGDAYLSPTCDRGMTATDMSSTSYPAPTEYPTPYEILPVYTPEECIAAGGVWFIEYQECQREGK